jgi:alpha-tubulin suppressor-like RCC1 family protein
VAVSEFHIFMPSKFSTGVVYNCGASTSGQLNEVTGLLGFRIINVSGVCDRCFALTDLDAYDINTCQKSGIEFPLLLESGETHKVALTTHGELYSWGSGEYGELGLGHKCSEVDLPTKLIHSVKFTSLSCGSHHSCAINIHGNMFTWGQNFDRQLGLYRKKESELPPNSTIEEIAMTPKCVPFSITNPIKMVACGSNFTVVITEVSQYNSLS